MAKHPRSQSGSKGRLSGRPDPGDGLVPRTLEFVYNQLAVWRDDPTRRREVAEKDLNSSLWNFLDRQSRFHFAMARFQHESPQGQGRTTDFAVLGMEETTLVGGCSYTSYDPFMVMEAKRLPAPRPDREREYVFGNNASNATPTGGIQRFKLGRHGAQVGNAVLVGYVQEQTARIWFDQVNHWINDLTTSNGDDGCGWSETDKLQDPVYDDTQQTAKSSSSHQRIASVTTQIQLHHFWVVMGSESQ